MAGGRKPKTLCNRMDCVVILVMIISYAPAVWAEEYCYADDTNQYLNFSIFTSYEFVRNRGPKPIAPDSVTNCEPVQIFILSRHGPRYPDSKGIKKLQTLNELKGLVLSNHKAGKGSLCEEDLEHLEEWAINIPPSLEFKLTRQGQEESYVFGEQIRTYFPKLIKNKKYSPDIFVFRKTDTLRTKESAAYFAKGLFRIYFKSPPPTLPVSEDHDQLLEKFEQCTSWLNAYGTKYKNETLKFQKSEYMKQVVSNVSKRLGFDQSLSVDDIIAMYEGCAYQKAWYVHLDSPWCAAFSKDDLEVLEYKYDLKFYYLSGPGNWMNLRLACPLAKDIFERFARVEEDTDKNHPVGVFYFTHDIMLDMLSHRLGFPGSDRPLTADNFPQQKNRQYRMSYIAPFAGNILIVLYKCNSSGDPLKLMFFQNENKVSYEGCTSEGLCDWSYIKGKLRTFVEDPACIDNSFCNNFGPTAHQVSIIMYTFSALFLLGLIM